MALYPFLLAPILLLLSGAASGKDYDRRLTGGSCKTIDPPCLDTFAWCGNSLESGADCNTPDDINPFSSTLGFAALWDTHYTLRWKNAVDGKPMNVKWVFGDDGDFGLGLERGFWERNFTNGETSFDFTFKDLAADSDNLSTDVNSFSTERNLTTQEVRGFAAYKYNYFQLLQADIGTDDNYAEGVSFAVLPELKLYIGTGEEKATCDVSRNWKLGVGLGVGLGVPLLVIAAFRDGMRHGKNAQMKKSRAAEHSLDQTHQPHVGSISSRSQDTLEAPPAYHSATHGAE